MSFTDQVESIYNLLETWVIIDVALQDDKVYAMDIFYSFEKKVNI